MFRAIYESPWHSPVALWALAIVLFAWVMRRRPFLTAWLALFTVEILADDRAFPADVAAWCRKTNNTLVSIDRRADAHVAIIKKGGAEAC